MNKLLVGFVVIVMVLVAVPSIAQDDDVKFKFGVKGGWFFWTADELKDSDFDNNWIVGADATAWFDNGLGIGAGVQFLKKTVEYKEFDRETSYRAIPLNLNLFYKVPMEEGSAMYVGAGPSLVLLDVESDVVVGDAIAMSLNSEDKAWGFNAVVGFEMQNFFIEGQYLWAKAGVEDAPDLDKSQYGGVSVMAGYRF